MVSGLEAYEILERLAKEPINDTSFPTNFQVIIKLRNALSDPEVAFKTIANILSVEPLISSKIMVYANNATTHNLGNVTVLEKAISRIGLSATRRLALAVAMVQLSKSSETMVYAHVSRAIWLHSLYVASAASVLAKHLTKINPEEAQFTGLLINLGAFFLLYKAGCHSGLQKSASVVCCSVARHNHILTQAIIPVIGLSEQYSTALDIQPTRGLPLNCELDSLRDVIQAANCLSDVFFQFDNDAHYDSSVIECFKPLCDEIYAKYEAMREEFK